jgi:hypothetical protein
MIVKPIDVPYFIQKVKNHKVIKDYYINEISKLPTNKVGTVGNSDWNLKDNPINYSFFASQIQENLENMANFFKVKNCKLHNFWFQQYNKNDHHIWHTHGECNYTNVYYLEVDSGATEVKNPFTLKTIKMKVKEGDILSMPGFLLHRSPKFKKNITKSIIAFNTSFKSANY